MVSGRTRIIHLLDMKFCACGALPLAGAIQASDDPFTSLKVSVPFSIMNLEKREAGSLI